MLLGDEDLAAAQLKDPEPTLHEMHEFLADEDGDQ
jgi:hypothetical protein